MVRKRDPFWEHGLMLENKFECNYCKHLYSGGITRLKFHLSGLKGNDVEVCTLVPNDVRVKAYMAVESNSKRIRSDASTASIAENVGSEYHSSSVGFPGMSNLSPLFKSKGGTHQTTTLAMLKKMDKRDVDNLLTRFFVLNNISFNVVRTQSFIDLVRALCEFGSTYRPPSLSTLRTKLIPEAKEEVDGYVDKVKKAWEKTGCTIMFNTWSDMKQRCFINFVAHSSAGAAFLRSVEISKERMTAHLLKDMCSKVIDLVGPQHVVQFVTENASNVDCAVDMLTEKYPTIYKTNCAAHGILLLFEDIYAEVEWLRCIVDDARTIQSYMYTHELATTSMREATKGKELKKPCAATFASKFLVQSIVAVETELRIFIASPEWRGSNHSKTIEGTKITQIVQNDDFWSEARDAIQVLEPLVRILRLVHSDGSTFGYLYQAMEIARESIEFKSNMNEGKYGPIKALLKKRRDDNMITPMHAAAAFLNPAYMLSDSFKETCEMKQGINNIFDNLVVADEKQAFLEQVQLYRMAYARLFTSSARAMLRTSHPRIWWDYCGDILPVLKKHAIRILSQPCSSSSYEPSWSAFEVAQIKKTNRLSPEILGALVYVRMNAMMMENFYKKEVEDMKPIDLDKLKEWPDYRDDQPIIKQAANAEDEQITCSSWEKCGGITDLESICLTIDDNDMHDFESVAYDGNPEPAGQNLSQGEEEYGDVNQLPTTFLGITPLDNLDVSCIVKERITQALRYFKELNKQNQILVQLWAPVKVRNCYVLSTSGQPFVLGPYCNGLKHYRAVSLLYSFAVDGDSKGGLGLPDRVFRQKLSEWTPNVQYYTSKEEPRVHHAEKYDVRGTLALPVFEPSGQSCIGLLELVMTSQKISYASEINNVRKALEVVNLKNSEVLNHPNAQIRNEGRQNALAEILEVLTEVCITYKLPLAQTWMPCVHRSPPAYGGGLSKSCLRFDGGCTGQVFLSTTDVAFYVVDASMWGFRDACTEHRLQAGQGAVGRAFESRSLCFCRGISLFRKTEYPLAHYARMFRLANSFAICLRSEHTGDDDYVLEFFLPPSITDSTEQLKLLDSIVTTMKQGLRTVTAASGRPLEEERKHMETVDVSMDVMQRWL